MEFCEGRGDHGGGEDLVEGVGVAELGVGVFGGVEVVDAGNFSKVGGASAVSGCGRSWLVDLDCFSVGFLGKGRERRGAHFSMYSLPAFPNICAAPGALVTPRVAAIIPLVVPVGLTLSLKKLCRLPGNIFSNPTTITQSAIPWLTMFLAIFRPVEPVEQLLLTL